MWHNYFLSYVIACPKHFTRFLCPNYLMCIPTSKLCNGLDDCGDNRDENPDICKFLMNCKNGYAQGDINKN